MLKKFIDKILYTLHLKKRDERPAIDIIMDTMPTILAGGIMMGIMKQLFPPKKPTRFERWRYNIKHFIREWRFKYIGY